MKKLKFKTNINCSGCVARVTPALNASPGIETWDVNIDSPGKTLTITTDNLEPKQIIETIKQAGFNAEEIKN
jgi:copper chaperone